MSDEEKIAAVQKSLGEPVFIGFSDETLRVRRNMLVFTFITLSYAFSGASIQSFSPFGITFNDFDSNHINTVFFFLVAYHFIHFLWQSFDALLEWRIRITGTHVAFSGRILGVTGADYPDNPRQSSLMTWWAIESARYPNIENAFENISENASDIKRELQHLQEILKSDRIPASLGSFEKWFQLFSWSQLLRWFVLEWMGPLLLAICALILINPWDDEASKSKLVETICASSDRIEGEQESHYKCISIKKATS